MTQLEMFGQNMYLLVGMLFSCFCGFLLLIALLVGIKVAWWRFRRRLAHRAVYGTKYDELGRALPRSFRGGCTRCGHLFDVVYTISEHRNLCTRCYRMERAERDRCEQVGQSAAET